MSKSYHRMSLAEREELSILYAQGEGLRAIARTLNRSPSTISRKLVVDGRLRHTVLSLLRQQWSPEQIGDYLSRVHPNEPRLQVSAETIYSYLYVLPRGELRRELLNHLRQHRKTRRPRSRGTDRRGQIPEMISIEERPPEVADRTIPGHWEGDIILGRRHQTALGTLVERTTRAVLLVRLPARDATSVRKAFARKLRHVPKQMRLSLTYDRGKEMAEHKLFTRDTQMKVYFAHPQSPWERGTNENTNGLIRQYFPKGTDFNEVSAYQIRKVQNRLNGRPRKVLNAQTPFEAFNQLLH